MKLSALKIFALKLALFSGMLAYMAIDLFLWHGPLWRVLYPASPMELSPEDAPMALVYGEKISAAQLNRYVDEQDWLSDRAQSAEARRTALLMGMVRSAILRIRARYNDKNLPDFAAEAEAQVQQLASRAKSPEEFDRWLTEQGYGSREQFTQKLHAILKATSMLDRAVAPFCEVSDDDVAKHYELIRDELIAPAHRPLRHIFLATLDKDVEAVRTNAQHLLDKIERGEADFAELARTHSEDDRTAPLGGDLGEVQDDSEFLLPELPLFGENALPAGKPALAQSRWGWHILLPGEIQPARQLTLDETRESLRTAIQSAQYELAVQNYLDQAIREAFHKKHLRINHASK